ncbi:hypothetical protein GCM10027290_13450 [Micromonospora sonneratiae]|uniref:Tryptophan-associated transmembrane protein (Trp_oprn_chp) n=1 Tax=Micromonospora sonneratiae TaxID=1184706 RepID=A0ABW3YTD1_9ACTN
MTDTGSARNRPDSALLWIILVALGTAAAYIGLLGWDQQKVEDPVTGSMSGPYEPWQVIACVLVLALIAGVAGWRGRPWVATAVLPVVFTALFAVDAATDPDADGLWIIGTALVAIGSSAGTAVVAGLCAYLRNRALRSRTTG